MSNSHWNSWNAIESGNGNGSDIGVLRNERLGFGSRYYLGHEDAKFQIPTRSDLYNRTFGIWWIVHIPIPILILFPIPVDWGFRKIVGLRMNDVIFVSIWQIIGEGCREGFHITRKKVSLNIPLFISLFISFLIYMTRCKCFNGDWFKQLKYNMGKKVKMVPKILFWKCCGKYGWKDLQIKCSFSFLCIN